MSRNIDPTFYEQWFNDANTNGNGFLSLDEFSRHLNKGGFKGKKVKDMFNSCDANKDGKITFNEFMQAMGLAPVSINRKATLRAVFYDFDKDNSGEIDKKELDSVFDEMGKHFTQEELVRMIGLADKDGDGKMNIEEFMQKVFNTSAE